VVIDVGVEPLDKSTTGNGDRGEDSGCAGEAFDGRDVEAREEGFSGDEVGPEPEHGREVLEIR
jgi:hypothetical protein